MSPLTLSATLLNPSLPTVSRAHDLWRSCKQVRATLHGFFRDFVPRKSVRELKAQPDVTRLYSSGDGGEEIESSATMRATSSS